MDINSLIANYLKNTNNTEVNASQIKDTFYNLASEDLQFCDSIFVYGEDATKDELIEYMSKACGKDDDQFKEDVGLLFDVLNSNSDDDVLTSDELESFTRQRGDNQGKIDGFGIWNELLNTDVSKIESEMAGSELGELAQDIVDSGDVEGELAAYAAIYGEDSAEYKAIEEQVELAQSDSADSADSADGEGRSEEDINRMAQSIVDGKTTLEKIKSIGLLTDEEIAQLEDAVTALQENTEGTAGVQDTDDTEGAEGTEDSGNEVPDEDQETTDDGQTTTSASDGQAYGTNNNLDFSDKDVAKSFVESFIDDEMQAPADVINWLLSEGEIDAEQAALLESAYVNFSAAEEEQIRNLMALGNTYEEAVEKLQNKNKLTVDDSELYKTQEKTLSDEDIKIYVDQLFDAMDGLGTDDEQFEAILNNTNLSSADWVKIIEKFNNDHGSFISKVDGDFSFLSGKEDKMNKIADKLLEEAKKGNDEAINLLCKEFYNGTAGQTGTVDEFIARIFEKATPDILAKIARQYSSVNNGRDIFKDIKGDFSFGTEDDYIRLLNEALSEYKDE